MTTEQKTAALETPCRLETGFSSHAWPESATAAEIIAFAKRVLGKRYAGTDLTRGDTRILRVKRFRTANQAKFAMSPFAAEYVFGG